MPCTYRTLLAIIALYIMIASNIVSNGRTDEPAGVGSIREADACSSALTSDWSTLKWKKAAPSPFARVESPAAVVDGKTLLVRRIHRRVASLESGLMSMIRPTTPGRGRKTCRRG